MLKHVRGEFVLWYDTAQLCDWLMHAAKNEALNCTYAESQLALLLFVAGTGCPAVAC